LEKIRVPRFFRNISFVAGGYAPRAKSAVFAACPGA
jgi:hypothetical protein